MGKGNRGKNGDHPVGLGREVMVTIGVTMTWTLFPLGEETERFQRAAVTSIAVAL